jgi:hypothetical protein
VAALTVALGLLAAPLAAEAQQAGKVYRIGFLSPGGAEQDSFLWAPHREVPRERGGARAVPSGSWSGRRLSLGGEVTVTGATNGATGAGGRSC